ncbi:hypothetical protein [Vibrio fortis]|uniref:hypothetical protein n=1 Tax=Vibrio fortis TaxID=212667 RepID=UPI0038CD49BF
MLKTSDFHVDSTEFRFKNDNYPLSKINQARMKKLTLLDNLGQILFWVALFSGAVWVALPTVAESPLWLQILAACLTIVGFVFALFRCAKYVLQVEFRHSDGTGDQWITVAKTFSAKDSELLTQQANRLNEQCL